MGAISPIRSCGWPSPVVIEGRWSICFEKSGEDLVELYGVWNGDFTEPLQAREKILVDRILDANFLFKEGGFYEVTIEKK